ncbi:thioredoxin [Buchnera aphidicola]|uniref:thioredoxin n=1 Tax=Buchnera aphidicola TaxID=9 RepID=UPI0030EC93A0
MKSLIKNLTDESFDLFISKNSKNFILIDFWAKWCNPCKLLSPILEKLSKNFIDIKFVKVDIEKNPKVSLKYSIQSVPTLILMYKKKVINTKIGVSSKENLSNFLTTNINNFKSFKK